MDTMNRCGVSIQGNDVVFVLGVPPRMTKEQALMLAAWIVLIADPDEKEFETIKTAIMRGDD